MKVRTLLIFLIVACAVMQCHTYKKYDKDSFPDYSWNSDRTIIFKPTIDDTNKSYQLILGMRHVYGFQERNLILTITSITPSGVQNQQDYNFEIKDSQGKYIGICAGDICDLETVMIDNLRFTESGEYTFMVNHNLQVSKIPGVLEFGLIIDEK